MIRLCQLHLSRARCESVTRIGITWALLRQHFCCHYCSTSCSSSIDMCESWLRMYSSLVSNVLTTGCRGRLYIFGASAFSASFLLSSWRRNLSNAYHLSVSLVIVAKDIGTHHLCVACDQGQFFHSDMYRPERCSFRDSLDGSNDHGESDKLTMPKYSGVRCVLGI